MLRKFRTIVRLKELFNVTFRIQDFAHEVPNHRKGVNQDEKDGTEVKQEHTQQPQTAVKPETTSNTVVVQPTNTEQGHKPSMVAEPQYNYNKTDVVPIRI